MKPGRELDALIAQKVMGWEVKHSDELKLPSETYGPWPGRWAYRIPPSTGWSCMIPDFSTDIKAAWIVVERLHSEGVQFEIGNRRVFEPDELPFWAAFGKSNRHVTDGETAPHAICMAALGFVEKVKL